MLPVFFFVFFFLPGGRIDHGHHDSKAVKALNEAVSMNKAVTKALQMVNKGKITPFIATNLFFKGKIPHYIALLIESICILIFNTSDGCDKSSHVNQSYKQVSWKFSRFSLTHLDSQ